MNSFKQLGIKDEILQAIYDLGFEKLMPVQAKVLPILLENDIDIVALAQTGTGKTATFGLPIIEKLDFSTKHTEAIILSPTRELCVQIANDLTNYSKYIDNASVVPVYGGASIENQIKAIKRAAKVIVATPGRMLDLLRRRVIDISEVKYVVLDEADEMLSMGFQEDLDAILAATPKEKNIWLFSATMPKEVEKIARSFMHEPEIITVGTRNSGAENVRHFYYLVNAKNRYLALKRIADFYPTIYAIVFCRTKKETQEVADALIKDGYNADALHGDLSQAQRDHVMNKFRNKNIQMLVATDVAARGLDVFNLSHVINYNLPDETEQYIHRSGRTGRADKDGISIAIVNLKEKHKIRQIEKIIGAEFIMAKVPNGKEVCQKQLFQIISKMENVDLSNEDEIASFLPEIYTRLEWLSKEDLIQRFVSIEFNRFLDYYRNAPDLNVDERSERSERKSKSSERTRRDDGDRDSRDNRDNRDRTDRGERKKSDRNSRQNNIFATIKINLGRNTGTVPQRIIGVLNDTVRNRDMKIGHIEIMDNYSFVEVEARYLEQVFDAFDNRYDNKYYIEFVENVSYNHTKEKKKKDKGDKDRDNGRNKRTNDRRDNNDSRGSRDRDNRSNRDRDSRGSSDNRSSRDRDRRDNNSNRDRKKRR